MNVISNWSSLVTIGRNVCIFPTRKRAALDGCCDRDFTQFIDRNIKPSSFGRWSSFQHHRPTSYVFRAENYFRGLFDAIRVIFFSFPGISKCWHVLTWSVRLVSDRSRLSTNQNAYVNYFDYYIILFKAIDPRNGLNEDPAFQIEGILQKFYRKFGKYLWVRLCSQILYVGKITNTGFPQLTQITIQMNKVYPVNCNKTGNANSCRSALYSVEAKNWKKKLSFWLCFSFNFYKN